MEQKKKKSICISLLAKMHPTHIITGSYIHRENIFIRIFFGVDIYTRHKHCDTFFPIYLFLTFFPPLFFIPCAPPLSLFRAPRYSIAPPTLHSFSTTLVLSLSVSHSHNLSLFLSVLASKCGIQQGFWYTRGGAISWWGWLQG